MKVYTIILSEDGLFGRCATNIKALDKIIALCQYSPISIEYNNGEKWCEINYSYANLNKALKCRPELYGSCYINCKSGKITVEELMVVSK